MNLVVDKCESLGKTFHSKNLLSAQIHKKWKKNYIFYNIYFIQPEIPIAISKLKLKDEQAVE